MLLYFSALKALSALAHVLCEGDCQSLSSSASEARRLIVPCYYGDVLVIFLYSKSFHFISPGLILEDCQLNKAITVPLGV